MASLIGQQLKDTYDSLLKTTDNDALGGTYKEITDGSGNGSNLYLGTGGNLGIGIVPDGSDWNASSTLLHIYQNSTNGALLKLESSNTSAVLVAGSNQLQIGTIEAQPFNFYTGSALRMNIARS